MAKRRKSSPGKSKVVHYEHSDDTRTNIPTSVIAGQGAVPKAGSQPLRKRRRPY